MESATLSSLQAIGAAYSGLSHCSAWELALSRCTPTTRSSKAARTHEGCRGASSERDCCHEHGDVVPESFSETQSLGVDRRAVQRAFSFRVGCELSAGQARGSPFCTRAGKLLDKRHTPGLSCRTEGRGLLWRRVGVRGGCWVDQPGWTQSCGPGSVCVQDAASAARWLAGRQRDQRMSATPPPQSRMREMHVFSGVLGGHLRVA